jgi:hypothetical protein
MNAVVAAVGIVVLLFIAMGAGMSLDTEGQRREARRLADERRLRAQERRMQNATYFCPDCPFRDRN